MEMKRAPPYFPWNLDTDLNSKLCRPTLECSTSIQERIHIRVWWLRLEVFCLLVFSSQEKQRKTPTSSLAVGYEINEFIYVIGQVNLHSFFLGVQQNCKYSVASLWCNIMSITSGKPNFRNIWEKLDLVFHFSDNVYTYDNTFLLYKSLALHLLIYSKLGIPLAACHIYLIENHRKSILSGQSNVCNK